MHSTIGRFLDRHGVLGRDYLPAAQPTRYLARVHSELGREIGFRWPGEVGSKVHAAVIPICEEARNSRNICKSLAMPVGTCHNHYTVTERRELMTIYTIATLQPRPSMNQTCVQIDATDYADAVRQARESWARTHRATTLHSGKYAASYWHRIRGDGTFIDRNHNSGVPESGHYAA